MHQSFYLELTSDLDDAASDYKEICEGLSAKLLLCVVITLIETFPGFFSLSISLPLLGETIEGVLAFSVASFSPKGTSAEPGLVTLQPRVETIELIRVCVCALSSVHVGLCSEAFVIEYAPASLC